MSDRYYVVEIPREGKKPRRVSVRFGSYGPFYLCVGNIRIPLSTESSWALWAALGQALHAESERPKWADTPVGDTAAVRETPRVDPC
jgi:hypothetical protein